MSLRFPAALIAGMTFVALSALPAQALGPDDAAKALGTALTEGSNIAASYTSAALDGDDIVIKGFSIARTSVDQTVSFDTVVIKAPTTGGDGVFQTPELTFTNGTITGKSTGSVGTVTVTDATILDPAEGKKNGFGGSVLFKTAVATDLHMSRPGEPGEVTVATATVESGNVVDNVAESSRGSVEDIALSPELVAAGGVDPKSIGYDSFVFDVAWDSARDVAAKTMTINTFTVNFHHGGELSVDGVVGNLPDPRVLNDEGATTKASAAEVHRLRIRYDDDSLAGRVLNFLAAKQGLDRDAYVQQISAALPFLLASLNNPAFQNQVVKALIGFLRDPHSLTIDIQPDSPVSGAELLSLAKTSPGAIPDRLKATVTANAPQ